jgi:hypothetical protein
MNELNLEDTTPVRITQATSPFVSNSRRSVLPHTCVWSSQLNTLLLYREGDVPHT